MNCTKWNCSRHTRRDVVNQLETYRVDNCTEEEYAVCAKKGIEIEYYLWLGGTEHKASNT